MRNLLSISLSILVSSSALGAQSAWNTTVTKILVEDGKYGGCMVYLASGPADQGLDCPATPAVTMDCEGNTRGKTIGNVMLGQAQLALVAGNTVRVKVIDTTKINSYCLATRIDVIGS